ncbi:DUF6059 family protein [Micromonospora kangleipakensis]|uniref:DUF6059 family protein n=1 Tax=Micromonospora kangleipakensis TaxID=1077942 RepID=UPI0010296A12|nr:DUF6059 family protein [Micromonospora kangleipakensis]
MSRTLWLGLQHCGASYTGLILPPPAAAPDPEGAAPTVTAPASGHPERLAAHVPMSPVEERLWADLGHHRREA